MDKKIDMINKSITIKNKILNNKDNILVLPKNKMQTNICLTILSDLCKDNEDINVCLSTNNYNYIDTFIKDISTSADIKIDKNDERCILTFVNNKSTLVICRYQDRYIYLKDGDITSYDSKLYFEYSVIYFDNVDPCDIKVKSAYSIDPNDRKNEILDYFNTCVKKKFIFIINKDLV